MAPTTHDKRVCCFNWFSRIVKCTLQIRVAITKYTKHELICPDAPCMEYLTTFGIILIIFGVNVGKYLIHGASGLYQ